MREGLSYSNQESKGRSEVIWSSSFLTHLPREKFSLPSDWAPDPTFGPRLHTSTSVCGQAGALPLGTVTSVG